MPMIMENKISNASPSYNFVISRMYPEIIKKKIIFTYPEYQKSHFASYPE
jgi:hypothetical protein